MSDEAQSSYDFGCFAPGMHDDKKAHHQIEQKAEDLNLTGFVSWDMGGQNFGYVEGTKENIEAFFDFVRETVQERAIDFDDFHWEKNEREDDYTEFKNVFSVPEEIAPDE